jgi:hypothetical protein
MAWLMGRCLMVVAVAVANGPVRAAVVVGVGESWWSWFGDGVCVRCCITWQRRLWTCLFSLLGLLIMILIVLCPLLKSLHLSSNTNNCHDHHNGPPTRYNDIHEHDLHQKQCHH